MQIYKIVKNSSHSFLLSIVSLMFIFLFNNCSKFETTNNLIIKKSQAAVVALQKQDPSFVQILNKRVPH